DCSLLYLPHSCHLFLSTPPSPTVLYTLSLHDALPICSRRRPGGRSVVGRYRSWAYSMPLLASASTSRPTRRHLRGRAALVLLPGRDCWSREGNVGYGFGDGTRTQRCARQLGSGPWPGPAAWRWPPARPGQLPIWPVVSPDFSAAKRASTSRLSASASRSA